MKLFRFLVNGRVVLDESHEEVADILRDLRASDELPVFTLYRYPLVQGFERLVNEEESDPEETDEFPSHAHNGISQQLNFSLISSSDAEPVTENLPAPVSSIPDEFAEPEPLPVQNSVPVNHLRPVETPPPITPLDSAHAFDPSPISNSFEPVIHSSPEKIPEKIPSPSISPVVNSRVSTPPEPSPEPVNEIPAVPLANIEIVPVPVKPLPVDQRPPSPVRKPPSVQINRPITDYQSPKPFKSPDQLVNFT